MSTLTKQDLLARIAALELEEHQVSTRRRKLHDRIAIFASEALEQAERELSDYRRDLYRRIEAAHAELAKLRNAERQAREAAESAPS